jgi:phage tail sheath protein FI
MAFQVSPGVAISEIDLTTVIPAVSTATGALAGQFQWGPVNEIRQITNEIELVDQYGKPDANTFDDFFTAANFLSYSGDIRIVRAANTVSGNTAFSSNTGNTTLAAAKNTFIKNDDDYLNNYYSGTSLTSFAARSGGELGSSLKVSLWANTPAANFSNWAYSSYFDKAPGTSNYIATNFSSTANDQMYLVVLDEDGKITGTANTLLEKYDNLSKAPNAKDENGESIYYKDVLFRKSKYVFWSGHPNTAPATGTSWGTDASSGMTPYADLATTRSEYSLSYGSTAAVTSADLIAAYDLLKNSELVDISLVMTSDHPAAVKLDVINNLAGVRKDCVAFVSPSSSFITSATPTSDIITYRKNSLNNVTSSYAVMDGNWKYQYDKYNDVYRWVPLNGDIAGLCARTDADRDPWFSPAGVTRGQIKNVVKFAYVPTKANRDELYKNDINPVVSFPGEGNMLFGDKTMLGRPSAFDRINVRRLFIVLEKAISKASRSSLFEFNDEFTRAQFVNLVEPFLRTVQGRRGIYDYRVVCDTTNNTPEVIDRNEFVGDIYIKPAKSINYIQLNFVAVRTGVAFEEVVGKF